MADGGFTADFFDEQARSLLDGRLDVDPAVASIEGYEDDGRIHFYYGLFPALLRVPVAAVSDGYDGRLGAFSMLAALVVAGLAAGRLSWLGRGAIRGWDVPLGRREPWVVGAFVAAVGLSTPLLWLASKKLVYHEAELWGAALTMLAFARILVWWERPTLATLAGASVVSTLAIHSRGSVGLGAVVALGAALALAAVRRRRPPIGWALAAVALPLLTYCAVNVARFDTPFSIPFTRQVLTQVDEQRQAALAANDGGLFGPQFVPTAAWAYLRPDGIDVQPLFPWITFRESTTVIGEPVFDVVDRTASLPVAAPAVLVLALVGLPQVVRRATSSAWGAVVVGAGVGVVPTIAIGFIANRYLSDFVPLLVPSAALGTWWVVTAVRRPTRSVASRLLVGGLGGLAAFGLLTNVALALQAQHLLLIPEPGVRADFVSLQYDLDRRDGPVPEIRALGGDDPGPVRDRGAIAVLGDCDAVYWSDGLEWFPLELGADLRHRLLGGTAEGSTTLLRGPNWRITVVRDGDRLRAEYAVTGGGPIPRPGGGPVAVDAGEDVELVVERDPYRRDLFVYAGDRLLLSVWPADVSGPVEVGDGWTPRPVATPLCEQLSPSATR